MVLVLVLVLTTLAPRPAVAEIDRDQYRSSDHSVELIVPEGWVLSNHRSYAQTLVIAVRRDSPGQMILSMFPEPAGMTLRQYCEHTRRVLHTLRYRSNPLSEHSSGALIIDATTPDSKTLVRQAYQEHAGRIYVLTLAVPAALMPAYQDGFDQTLRNMRFFAPKVDKRKNGASANRGEANTTSDDSHGSDDGKTDQGAGESHEGEAGAGADDTRPDDEPGAHDDGVPPPATRAPGETAP